MKILCVIDSLGSGGAQRQLVNLAVGFKEKGHDVSFLVYHQEIFFKEILDKNEIPVKEILEPNYLLRLIKMRRYIRKGNYNAVLSFLEAANFICEIAGFPRRKWKLVVGERSANPNIMKSFKLRIYRWFHLFADYVVANSHANLDMVKKINPFLPKEKMKVIYNIVNVPQIETQQKKYPNKTHIVVAASYRDVKNLDGLIEAVKLLPQEYKEKLRIDWYGNTISEKNSYFNYLNKEIKALNIDKIMYLHEQTSDIFYKYSEADFVGLFSHYEGFPNAIVEAMSLSKPIIASNVSDIPYFIKDEYNGFLCNSKESESISLSIIKAINLSYIERVVIGGNNKTIIQKKFNRNSIIQEYLILLQNKFNYK